MYLPRHEPRKGLKVLHSNRPPKVLLGLDTRSYVQPRPRSAHCVPLTIRTSGLPADHWRITSGRRKMKNYYRTSETVYLTSLSGKWCLGASQIHCFHPCAVVFQFTPGNPTCPGPCADTGAAVRSAKWSAFWTRRGSVRSAPETFDRSGDALHGTKSDLSGATVPKYIDNNLIQTASPQRGLP